MVKFAPGVYNDLTGLTEPGGGGVQVAVPGTVGCETYKTSE